MHRKALSRPLAHAPLGVIHRVEHAPALRAHRAHGARCEPTVTRGDGQQSLVLRVDLRGVLAMRRHRTGAASCHQHAVRVLRALKRVRSRRRAVCRDVFGHARVQRCFGRCFGRSVERWPRCRKNVRRWRCLRVGGQIDLRAAIEGRDGGVGALSRAAHEREGAERNRWPERRTRANSQRAHGAPLYTGRAKFVRRSCGGCCSLRGRHRKVRSVTRGFAL